MIAHLLEEMSNLSTLLSRVLRGRGVERHDVINESVDVLFCLSDYLGQSLFEDVLKEARQRHRMEKVPKGHRDAFGYQMEWKHRETFDDTFVSSAPSAEDTLKREVSDGH